MNRGSLAWAYRLLGLAPGADEAMCRRAYRRSILEHHPDRLGEASADRKRRAEEQTKDVNLAWEVLREHFASEREVPGRKTEMSSGGRPSPVYMTPPRQSGNPWRGPGLRKRISLALFASLTGVGLIAGGDLIFSMPTIAESWAQDSSGSGPTSLERTLIAASQAYLRHLATSPEEGRLALAKAVNDERWWDMRDLVSAGIDPNLPVDPDGKPPLAVLVQKLSWQTWQAKSVRDVRLWRDERTFFWGDEATIKNVLFLLKRRPNSEALNAAASECSDTPAVLDFLIRHADVKSQGVLKRTPVFKRHPRR
ncbi:J domain-containing protein [bacterium]|nr:MAG: J domain-containing protein [bacterium]